MKEREFDLGLSGEQLVFLQTIIDTAPVPIFIKDREGLYRGCNKAFEEYMGISREEIKGKTVYDISPRELAEVYRKKDEELFAHPGVQNYEASVHYTDGTLHQVIFNKALFNGPTGEVAGLVGVMLDITELKSAQGELEREMEVERAMAELSRLLLATTSLGEVSNLVLDFAKHFTSSKFGFVGYIDQDTGYLVNITMTRDIWAQCEVEQKDFVFKEFNGLWGWVLKERQPLLTNQPSSDPRSTGTPPGHIPIHNFLSAPALAGGELVGQVALANSDRDYNERDLALVRSLAGYYALAVQRMWIQDSLEQAKDFAEKVIETADAIVMIRDMEGNVRLFNQAAENVTGYKREEIIGKNWFDLVVPRDRYPEAWEKFQEFRGGRKFEHEPYAYTILTRAGNERYISWRSSELRERGKLTGLITIGIDVTERRESERRLVELNRDLQAFASTLTHDLKSPLGKAMGYAELLQEAHSAELSEEAEKGVEVIRRSLERMNELIDGMLDYVQTGKGEPQKERTDLNRLIGRILSELREEEVIGEARLEVEEGLPVIDADPLRVYQALKNLISNAAKFMAGQNDPRIEIGILEKRGENVLFVRDNGMGIESDRLEDIFDPLVRTRDAADAAGFGIGLAIVRRAVESWGGRVWAESDYGNGSTFYFTLPG